MKTSNNISKDLENINFRELLKNNSTIKDEKEDFITISTIDKMKRMTFKNTKISPNDKKCKNSNGPKTQLEAFQAAMKLLFVLGILIGLNPVQGLLDTDVKKIRFSVCHWRSIQCLFIGITQTVSVILCVFYIIENSVTIDSLAYFAYTASTCITTFLFIRIGSKWSKLLKDISKCKLDEYIDTRVKVKCYIASVTILCLAIVEHLLSVNAKVMFIYLCKPEIDNYEKYLKIQFPWIFSINVPANIPVGIFLLIINLICTINWSYSDLYIMCMSIYLTSILEQINKKIISTSQQHYISSSYWRSLREDYNRATNLVRSFDDVLSGNIFTCFATNLFFICLQLFNILMHGVENGHMLACPSLKYAPFFGHEHTIYLLFSIFYLLAKSLTTSLMASNVNSASMVPAPALYNVPSTAFCDEVSRFINQVNGDTVALSGLQFFYVTRDLVLSVAGTIVTYELVLLQFSSDEIGK